MIPKYVLIAYAIFLFVGAFFGYKAGSKVSLIAGVISGILVLAGVYFVGLNTRNGYLYLTVLNGLLTFVFLMRFLKTRSFMPAGMLLLASLVVAIFCLIIFLRS